MYRPSQPTRNLIRVRAPSRPPRCARFARPRWKCPTTCTPRRRWPARVPEMRVERSAPTPRPPALSPTCRAALGLTVKVEPAGYRSRRRRRSGYFTPGHCCHNLVYSAPRAQSGGHDPTATPPPDSKKLGRSLAAAITPGRKRGPPRRNRHTYEVLDRHSAPCRAVRVREFYAPHTAGDHDHQASTSSRNRLAGTFHGDLRRHAATTRIAWDYLRTKLTVSKLMTKPKSTDRLTCRC
jgi:hypothetical protein